MALESLEGRWLLSAAAIYTPGLYAPASSTFALTNDNTATAADLSFAYGPANSQWVPLAGDWKGNGVDTVGLYNPATSTFYLRESNAAGAADISFSFGPANSTWIPLAGDWPGRGVDTVGLYNPATSTFYLRDSNTAGAVDISFSFGPANSTWIPLAGDWTGSGVDTVGLYDPATSNFYLRDSNTAGAADIAFSFGPANSTSIPLAGDWTGSGVDTVGLYDPATSTFSLRNSNSAGSADLSFSYGSGGAGLIPLAGRWDVPTFLGLGDTSLANLTQNLFVRDNAITRQDMMQILTSVGTENGGVLDATDLSDLRTIVSDATKLDMPGYVSDLAHKVVNGNSANTFDGGNLYVGAPASQLDALVGQWFSGDGPISADAAGIPFVAPGGYLFGAGGPSYTDVYQGGLGDCTLMASLAEVAARQPDIIRNMFIDNGDGTYTVRFYDQGVPDYVTVNTQLPDGGGLYAGVENGFLWPALAEKAIVEENESGWLATIDPGSNSYAAIDDGNAGTTVAFLSAITGLPADSYGVDPYSVASAWQAGQLIVLGSGDTPYASYVYNNHAYAVVGYNPSSTLPFTLFNPWGIKGGWSPAGQFYYGEVAVNSATISIYFTFTAADGSAPLESLPSTALATVVGTAQRAAAGAAGGATAASGAEAVAGVIPSLPTSPASDVLFAAWGDDRVRGSVALPEIADNPAPDEPAGLYDDDPWALYPTLKAGAK